MHGSALVMALLAAAATAAEASPPACAGKTKCQEVQGRVTSGAGPDAAPIAGAGVEIYAAQQGAPTLLGSAATDADGAFSMLLPAADGGVRYAIARKGAVVELATVMGTGNAASIAINEMTTVAAAYAMSQFLRDGAIAGKPLPLAVAAGMAANLVSATSGAPSAVMRESPNADETNAWRLLGTLANVLAGCVRDLPGACAELFDRTAVADPRPTNTLQAVLAIARNPAANVGAIFDLGEIATPYEPRLLPIQGPRSPDELQRLDGFTLAVKVNATGRLGRDGREECPFGGPGNLAFDANGYAWITNNVVQGTTGSTDCMVVLAPNGEPADGARGAPSSPIFGGGILGQGFGIGIDPSGNIWAGNFGWGGVIPNGSVSKFGPRGQPISPSKGYAQGLDRVQGTTSDQRGNIWMASSANNSVHVFPNGKPNASVSYQDGNTDPFHIVVDDGGSAWVSYSGTSAVSKFDWSGAGPSLRFTRAVGSDSRPKGLALDTSGNVWVAAGAADAVFRIRNDGSAVQEFDGGGILGPWGLTVDSRDNVWIANFGPDEQIPTKYRLSRLCGSDAAGNCPDGAMLGDPISPATGYTLPSAGSPVLLADGQPLYAPYPVLSYKPLMRATATRVDMAGNVWITNNWKPSGLNDAAANPGGDGIVIFVGLAAPVRPDYTGQPRAP